MYKLAQIPIGETFNSFYVNEPTPVGNLISLVLSLSLTAAGVIALFLFVIGGWSILMGAGEMNPEKAEKRKKMMTSGAIGFGVVFSAYWLIRLIEVLTGSTFLTNPGI